LRNLSSDILGILYPKKTISHDTILFTCGVSRSGTTLLTTILDSHRLITMGYELIPPPLPEPLTIVNILNEGLSMKEGDFSKCGPALRKKGYADIGQWLARCHRAGANADDVKEVLYDIQNQGSRRVYTLVQRINLAYLIAKRIQIKTGAAIFGFKFNNSHFKLGHKIFPGGYYIYIIRDPRDVAASQKQRGFDRTTKQICRDWNRYINAFMKFNAEHPHISQIIRYEDLVSQPLNTISKLFEKLPISFEEGVLKFYESKASVHNSKHPNAENLKQDFFTDSIGRWKNQLNRDDLDVIGKTCSKYMKAFKYETAN